MSIKRFVYGSCFTLLVLVTTSSVGLHAQQGSDQAELRKYQATVAKAIDYLRNLGQAEDGSFSGKAGTGPTSLVGRSLIANGQSTSDPMVKKSLDFVASNAQPDGGIYATGSRHKNYETCIAMVFLAAANEDKKYDEILRKAERFVKQLQWDEDEGKSPEDLEYGGAGYDSKSRPDLSNTAFFIEALRSVGNGPDDEAILKALTFVSRCQNLESEKTNLPTAAIVDDGGFFYTAAGGGESKAGTEPSGGLRSYGSMTYAGLKSMIFAGVSEDDPRIKAAISFLKDKYTLETNPGMGLSGLYYYYHLMAKSLDALGSPVFVDGEGNEHQWKSELLNHLAATQQPDGSWINTDSRWMEGDPNLVTGYTLLALSYCKPTEQTTK